MDYIREEFLHQRAALARLLLGNGPEETRQKKAEKEIGFQEPAPDWEMENKMAYGEESAATSAQNLYQARIRQGLRFGVSPADGALRGVSKEGGGAGWEEERTYRKQFPAAPETGNLIQERTGKRQAWEGPALLSEQRGKGRGEAPMESATGRRTQRYMPSWKEPQKSGDDHLPLSYADPILEAIRKTAETAGGAKDLSRAFQRDARRYDGGFELY